MSSKKVMYETGEVKNQKAARVASIGKRGNKMIGYILGLVIGVIFGIMFMSIIQVNKKEGEIDNE